MAKESKHDDDDEFIDDDGVWSDDDSELKVDELAEKLHSNEHRRQRDWRDMERYKEELELKRLMKDDYLFADDERSWRH